MKHSALLATLAILGSAGFGCSGESGGHKPVPPIVVEPEENVMLDLMLFDGDDFGENINAVDIGVFDVENNHIRTERVTRDDVEMTFEPGNYHLVFWANVDDRVRFGQDGETPIVTYSDVADFTATGQGEMVMYAPYAPIPTRAAGWAPADYYLLEVPTSGAVSEAIYFTPAYCSIDVYVDGLTDDPDRSPVVEIGGLRESLTYFGMKPAGEEVKVALNAQLVERDGQLYNAASFDSPLFNESALQTITLSVNDATGEQIYNAPMTDVLQEAGGSDYDPSDLNIDILVSVEQSGIKISFPKWSSGEVGI